MSNTTSIPPTPNPKLALIIDDQPGFSQLVVESIEQISADWRGLGSTLPQEGIGIAESRLPNLVICDQKMPGMLGTDCLERVSKVAPKAMRIIMSGDLDGQAVARCSAHQQLLKPFGLKEIEEAIERTTRAQEGLQSTGLADIVPALRSLPMMPESYQRLRRELEDETTSNEMLAEIIAADPSLSARVLHLANSAAFGRETITSSPKDAVLYLGISIIESLTLSQQIFKAYGTLRKSPIQIEPMWDYSWEVARRTRDLCRSWGFPEEDTEAGFLAGMLQEIGMLVLLDNLAARTTTACNNAIQSQIPLQQALKAEFGGGSREISYYILELWGMPQTTAKAVLTADSPQPRIGSPPQIADALYIASQETWRKMPYLNCPTTPWCLQRMQEIGYTPKTEETKTTAITQQKQPPAETQKNWWAKLFN